MCAECPLFQQTGLRKLRELYIFCLEGGLVSPKRARNTGCAALWRIFSSKKSVPANRKKGFGNSLPKNEEIKGTVLLTNQICLCPHPIYMYSALSPIYPRYPVSFNFNLILTYPSVLAWTWSILFARSLGRLEWNQGWDLCMVACVSVSLSPTGAATRRLKSTTK